MQFFARKQKSVVYYLCYRRFTDQYTQKETAMKLLQIFTLTLGLSAAALHAQPAFTAEQILGLGYQPGDRLAYAYAERGITSVKTLCGTWQVCEPAPPDSDGTHHYNWSAFDSIVVLEQASGITEFCIWLGTESTWGTCPHWASYETTNRRRPLPEHEQDYIDWVRAVVERYDHDGVDDAPGLRYPVLYYMVESEAQQFFYFEGCSGATHLQDYIDVLRMAHRGIKAACPTARVGLAACLFGDGWDDFPDSATIRDRARVGDSLFWATQGDSTVTRSYRFMAGMLAQDSLYDFITFHPLTWWTGYIGQVATIRHIVDSLGVPPKVIIADDAPSGPMYYCNGFVPHLCAIKDSFYLEIGNGSRPLHNAVNAWFRADQARFATKAYLVALGLGVQRVWIETSQDWNTFYFAMPEWAFIGLVDVNLLFPRYSVPRPVLYTMRLLKQKFAGYATVTRLAPTADPARVYAYRFSDGSRPDMVALWYEDYLDQLPEDAPAETTGILLAGIWPGAHRILRTRIITAVGDSLPHADTLTTDALGNLTLARLDETPVFLEDLGPAALTAYSPALDREPSLEVSPNPFSEGCVIRVSPPTYMSIYDLYGRVVYSTEIVSAINWSPGADLPGVYFVQATWGERTLVRRVTNLK